MSEVGFNLSFAWRIFLIIVRLYRWSILKDKPCIVLIGIVKIVFQTIYITIQTIPSYSPIVLSVILLTTFPIEDKIGKFTCSTDDSNVVQHNPNKSKTQTRLMFTGLRRH